MLTTLLSLPTALRTDLQSKRSMILADGLSNDLAPLLAGARMPMAMLAAEPEPLAAITDLLSRGPSPRHADHHPPSGGPRAQRSCAFRQPLDHHGLTGGRR